MTDDEIAYQLIPVFHRHDNKIHIDVDMVVERFVRVWRERKARFFPFLNDEFRLEVPIATCSRDSHGHGGTVTYDEIHDLCVRPLGYSHGQECADLAWNLMERFLTDELAENVLKQNYDFDLPVATFSNERVHLQLEKDARLGRAVGVQLLKTIPETRYPDRVKWINTLTQALSKCTERLRTSSDDRIVISANPVDLLMTSMHTTGWRSCHDLDQGAYAAGNVSYMLDRLSLVAYAYRSSGYFAGIGELPVKSWRMLCYVGTKSPTVVLSREYPYDHKAYHETVKAQVLAMTASLWETTTDQFLLADTQIKGSEWGFSDDASESLFAPIHKENAPRSLMPGVEKIPCICCGSLRDFDDENANTDEDDEDDSPPYSNLVCYECRSSGRNSGRRDDAEEREIQEEDVG